jgi:hypothetical protein
MLKKNIDISNYSDLDLYAAFLPFLKRYIKSKGKRFSKNMPLRLVVELISKEMISDYNLQNTSSYSTDSRTQKIIRELAENGFIRLPSMRPKVKFTKKYKKVLDRLFFNKLKLPPHIKIRLTEDDPYYLVFNTNIDWDSAIKDPRYDYKMYSGFLDEFRLFLSRFLNIEGSAQGDPNVGELQVQKKEIYQQSNLDKVIKEIKDIAKKNNTNGAIRSLKFIPLSKNDGRLSIQISFPRGTYYHHKANIKDQLSNKLAENGFNTSFIRWRF